MEIIVGKTAGFCYGVKNTVNKTEAVLNKYSKIDCLGELVHNGDVIRKLEKLGLKTIEKIEDGNDKVIIRAHGVSKEVYEKAKEFNIELFDFTCPSVLKIHNIVEEHAKQGDYILIIGNKNHPEVIGIKGFAGDNSYVLENEEEIDLLINKLEKINIRKLFVVAQTTFNLEKFDNIINLIKDKLDNKIKIVIKNTICNATKVRQDETREISKKVEFMVIIGGKNSSNTKKLYEIAKENCNNVVIVENKNELDIEKIRKYKKIGVMAGASTPEESTNEVIDLIGLDTFC